MASIAAQAVKQAQANAQAAATQKAAQQAVAQKAAQAGADQAARLKAVQQYAMQQAAQQAGIQKAAQAAAQQAAIQQAAQRAAQQAAQQAAAQKEYQQRLAASQAQAAAQLAAAQQAAAKEAYEKRLADSKAQAAAQLAAANKAAAAAQKLAADRLAAAQADAARVAAQKASAELYVKQVQAAVAAKAKEEAAKMAAAKAIVEQAAKEKVAREAAAKVEAAKATAAKAEAARVEAAKMAVAKAIVEQAAKEKAAREAAAKKAAEQAAINKGIVNLSTVSQFQPYQNATSIVQSITGQLVGADRSAYVEPAQIGDQVGMNIAYWGEDQVNDVRDYLDDAGITVDKDTKVTYDSATDSYSATSSAVSSGADDSKKDVDKDTSKINQTPGVKEKDIISQVKDVLTGNTATVKYAVDSTGKLIQGDYGDAYSLAKSELLNKDTTARLDYGNAVDYLTSVDSECEGWLCDAVNTVIGVVGKATDAAKGAINATIQVSTQPIADALKPLTTTAQKAFDTLKENGQLMKDAILGLPDKITEAIDKTYDRVIDYMKPYTDMIATMQKGLLDLPVNIIKAITDQFQPNIDWLKGELIKGYDKIIETRDWAEAKFNEKLAPILDRINSLANLSMKDVEAYALGKFEELKGWMYAEWEKFKETPIGQVAIALGQIVGWLITTMSAFLQKTISDPENTALEMWNTGKAYAALAEKEGMEQLRQWCDEPLGSR